MRQNLIWERGSKNKIKLRLISTAELKLSREIREKVALKEKSMGSELSIMFILESARLSLYYMYYGLKHWH